MTDVHETVTEILKAARFVPHGRTYAIQPDAPVDQVECCPVTFPPSTSPRRCSKQADEIEDPVLKDVCSRKS
jgi:hypothetical protein